MVRTSMEQMKCLWEQFLQGIKTKHLSIAFYLPFGGGINPLTLQIYYVTISEVNTGSPTNGNEAVVIESQFNDPF